MGTGLNIAIIMLNLFSIIMQMKMLKGFDKGKTVAYILLGEIVMFVISYVVYALTSGGIPSEVHEASKWMILLTILPVNIMITYCPILSLINKKSFDDIGDMELKKKLFIVAVVAVFIFIIEIIYVKNIQTGIAKFAN